MSGLASGGKLILYSGSSGYFECSRRWTCHDSSSQASCFKTPTEIGAIFLWNFKIVFSGKNWETSFPSFPSVFSNFSQFSQRFPNFFQFSQCFPNFSQLFPTFPNFSQCFSQFSWKILEYSDTFLCFLADSSMYLLFRYSHLHKIHPYVHTVTVMYINVLLWHACDLLRMFFNFPISGKIKLGKIGKNWEKLGKIGKNWEWKSEIGKNTGKIGNEKVRLGKTLGKLGMKKWNWEISGKNWEKLGSWDWENWEIGKIGRIYTGARGSSSTKTA